MARILLVTPAPPRSRTGNRVTACRWTRILRGLGHRVAIAQRYERQVCDMLIALHARKSGQSIRRFHQQRPALPIIVALTGTDLYADIRTAATARKSLDLATRLVLLQPSGLDALPTGLREKTHVIFQSAEPPVHRLPPLKRVFEIVVSGHLRPVKDPFRAAMAARLLPPVSRIRITHIGAALSERMAARAVAEMDRNSRYRWLGAVPHAMARKLVARGRLLVLSSKMEGGANVIAEALVANVPVLSSRVSGSVGMLGEDYAGYFAPGDTRSLAELIERCERDERYYATLESQCARQAVRFRPSREIDAWRELIRDVF